MVHGNGAPGPDLDLHDGKLGLDDGMPRAATNTHPVRCEARAPTRRADAFFKFLIWLWIRRGNAPVFPFPEFPLEKRVLVATSLARWLASS